MSEVKKFVPFAIAALVILGGAAMLILTKKHDNHTTAVQASSDTKQFTSPQACDVFTLDDAKKILGDNAQKSDVSSSNASSPIIEVTQCLYDQPTGDTLASIKSQKQASLVVRGAKDQAGADSNNDVFKGSKKPPGVQDIGGYGDGAFWNPQFGQLNIYKNSNWYILSVGPITPTDKKIDDAKSLADVLINKL
jgi:hypothetical protein